MEGVTEGQNGAEPCNEHVASILACLIYVVHATRGGFREVGKSLWAMILRQMLKSGPSVTDT